MNTNLPLITIPTFITREFIRQNKQWTFVFSDAYSNKHNYFGQCSQAKGEPNAKVVFTCWSPCTNRPPSCYFYDTEFDTYTKDIIDECLNLIPRSNPIIPFPKIGLGCAKMKEKCPKTYDYLMKNLLSISYPSIFRDYNLKT